MRYESVNISDDNIDIISYSLYNRGDDNRADIKRMKKILYRAINRELTSRQRDCLTMYYFDGMKMRDIAREFSLSVSTVSRHIKTAEEKLRRIAEYYRF